MPEGLQKRVLSKTRAVTDERKGEKKINMNLKSKQVIARDVWLSKISLLQHICHSFAFFSVEVLVSSALGS